MSRIRAMAFRTTLAALVIAGFATAADSNSASNIAQAVQYPYWEKFFVQHFIGDWLNYEARDAVSANWLVVAFAILAPILAGGVVLGMRVLPNSNGVPRLSALIVVRTILGGCCALVALVVLEKPAENRIQSSIRTGYWVQQTRLKEWAEQRDILEMESRSQAAAAEEFNHLEKKISPLVALDAGDLEALSVSISNEACEVRLWADDIVGSWERPLIAWRMKAQTQVKNSDFVQLEISVTAKVDSGLRLVSNHGMSGYRPPEPVELAGEKHSIQMLNTSYSKPSLFGFLGGSHITERNIPKRRYGRDDAHFSSALIGHWLSFMAVFTDAEQAMLSEPAEVPMEFHSEVIIPEQHREEGEDYAFKTDVSIRDDDSIWMARGNQPVVRLFPNDPFQLAELRRLSKKHLQDRTDIVVKVVDITGDTVKLIIFNGPLLAQWEALRASKLKLRFLVRGLGDVSMQGNRSQRHILTTFSTVPRMVIGGECGGNAPPWLGTMVHALK